MGVYGRTVTIKSARGFHTPTPPNSHTCSLLTLLFIITSLPFCIAVEPDTEPEEVITIGRVCGHNDGPGQLSAELTFRYPPNEIVVINPARLSKQGCALLRVEWHMRHQTPIRVLYSHLEAELSIESRANQPPEVKRYEKDYGQGLPASSVYDIVDAFEEKAPLTRETPIVVVRFAGRASAEAKLDNKVAGPESRTAFFVRQMDLGAPDESAALSRYFASMYRRFYQLETFLAAYASYFKGVIVLGGEASTRSGSAVSPVDEKALGDNLLNMLRDYASAQMGQPQDQPKALADGEQLMKFLGGDTKSLPDSSNERESPACLRRIAADAGKRMVVGLRDDSTRSLIIATLPGLDEKLHFRPYLDDAIYASKECRLALAKIVQTQDREGFYKAIENYESAWRQLRSPLSVLQDALNKGIGFQADPLSLNAPEAADLSMFLKPPDECLAATLAQAGNASVQKQQCVEATRSRLLPLWLYLETTFMGRFAKELDWLFVSASASRSRVTAASAIPSTNPLAVERTQAPLQPDTLSPAIEGATASATVKISPAEVIVTPKVSRDTSPMPELAAVAPRPLKDRKKSRLPSHASAAVQGPTKSTSAPPAPLAGDTARAPSPLLRCDFTQGLTGWTKWDSSGRHPGSHVCALMEEEGERFLEFRRSDSGLTVSSVGIDREMNLDLPQLRKSCLQLEFEIREQSLPGGGTSNSDFPLQIELTYLDKHNEEHLWRCGFFINGSVSDPYQSLKVSADKWMRWKSSSLENLLPGLVRLKTLRLSGSGWDFLSRVKSVVIGAE